MNFPKKEIVDKVKKMYPKGTRVELLYMDDKQAPPVGTRGTVTSVDDIGTIHVKWDNGSSLGIAFGEDSCKKLDSVVTICYGQRKKWDDRNDAIKEFYEGMLCCEGCERDRYTNIYLKLKEGYTVCSDEPFE